MLRLRLALFACSLVLVALGTTACDRSKLPFFGQLGEDCYPNGTCAVGLVCQAGRCVSRGREDGSSPDIKVDGGPDQGRDGLSSCWPPGTSCVPSDPCATGGECSAAGGCVPQGGCDDGLDCTIDSCSGPGQCKHEPIAGRCALPAPGNVTRCFNDGETNPQNPCQRCDSSAPKQWSALADGAPCDDGDICSGPDRCQGGSCKADASKSCDDGLSCTQDACDGKGGCLTAVIDTGSCAIDGACYKDGDLGEDAAGACQSCDAATSQTSWTAAVACKIDGACVADGATHPKAGNCASCQAGVAKDDWTLTAGTCLIDDSCKKSGDKSADGCSTCDPAQDPRSWTPAANSCAIAGACLADQTAHPSGCLRCDAPKDTKAWSPVGATSVSSFDFEGSSALPAGWSSSLAGGTGVGWQLVSGKRARGGVNAMYYGDPAKSTYDTGAKSNQGTLVWGSFDLPAGKKAGLRFHVWLDVENTNQFDKLELYLVDGAGTTQLWKRPSGQTTLRTWLTVDVDLGAHAGKKGLQLQWRFDTVDNLNNKGEGVYLDEVLLYSGC
jgi:hypothetical protein